MKKVFYTGFLLFFLHLMPNIYGQLPLIKISDNNRFFVTSDNKPFFWLGDTGWLLFVKLTREETDQYLEDRKQKGFNVIQVMVIHDVSHAVNIYGDSAFIGNNPAHPKINTGNRVLNNKAYGFWEHIDYVIEKAAEKGLYIAMVPIWGNNIKSGLVTQSQAVDFTNFLTAKYKHKTNIIWINGGDIKGTDSLNIWKAIGKTLHKNDTSHLITFHPRGRSSSSEWFHNENWLDFNMFQSGHKDYSQDTLEPRIGEDNWKFCIHDYNLKPVKPMLDGEPSYERIPHGLHDTLAAQWTADDVRRYAYWSVLSGACGFTYGHNAVMQFYKPGTKGAYGCKEPWQKALNDSGAKEMIFIKSLLLSEPYFDRVPDQSIIAKDQGEKYDYLVASKGKDFAFIYTCNGRVIPLNLGKISGKQIIARWYNPKNGNYTLIGPYSNKGVKEFYPPGKIQNGNDWVLVLKSVKDKHEH